MQQQRRAYERFPRGTAASFDADAEENRRLPSEKVIRSGTGSGRWRAGMSYVPVPRSRRHRMPPRPRPSRPWRHRRVWSATIGAARADRRYRRRRRSALLTPVSQWWPCPRPWSLCFSRVPSPLTPPPPPTPPPIHTASLLLSVDDFYCFVSLLVCVIYYTRFANAIAIFIITYPHLLLFFVVIYCLSLFVSFRI